MKEIEATRLKLKAMELVEGTGLKWWKCVRRNSVQLADEYSVRYEMAHFDNFELALGLIEGKPVWEGDGYYDPQGFKWIARKDRDFANYYWGTCTWLPPAPKTAPVYLLVEDIKHWSKYNAEWHEQSNRLYEACRKTLKELK